MPSQRVCEAVFGNDLFVQASWLGELMIASHEGQAHPGHSTDINLKVVTTFTILEF